MKLEPGDTGKEATEKITNLAEALREARSAIKAWQEREDDLKSQIVAWLDGADCAVTGKACVVRTRVVTTRRFSSKAFSADHPDLYEQYLGESSYTKVEV